MKKVIFLLAAVLLTINGFTQNASIGTSSDYTIKTQVVDSARTFCFNDYPNGEQLRKIFMLAWGRPNTIEAGSLVWYNLNIQNVGANINVKLADGIETTQNGTAYFKTFPDDNTKYEALKDMQSNQKRKITLVFLNQQNANVVNSRATENNVISVINNIIRLNR